jgi:hypothetical protein
VQTRNCTQAVLVGTPGAFPRKELVVHQVLVRMYLRCIFERHKRCSR